VQWLEHQNSQRQSSYPIHSTTYVCGIYNLYIPAVKIILLHYTTAKLCILLNLSQDMTTQQQYYNVC